MAKQYQYNSTYIGRIEEQLQHLSNFHQELQDGMHDIHIRTWNIKKQPSLPHRNEALEPWIRSRRHKKLPYKNCPDPIIPLQPHLVDKKQGLNKTLKQNLRLMMLNKTQPEEGTAFNQIGRENNFKNKHSKTIIAPKQQSHLPSTLYCYTLSKQRTPEHLSPKKRTVVCSNLQRILKRKQKLRKKYHSNGRFESAEAPRTKLQSYKSMRLGEDTYLTPKKEEQSKFTIRLEDESPEFTPEGESPQRKTDSFALTTLRWKKPLQTVRSINDKERTHRFSQFVAGNALATKSSLGAV